MQHSVSVKLGELISTRQKELGGPSLEALAKKAREQGYTLTKATLSAFVTRPLPEVPRRKTLEALAVALEVSFPEVALAATESLIGTSPIEVENQQRVSAWLTLTGGRTDEEVSALLRVVRTVAAALDAASSGGRNVWRSPRRGYGRPGGTRGSPELTERKCRRSSEPTCRPLML